MASPRVDTVMAQDRAASFTKRSIKNASKASALRIALSMLDLTTLEGKDSPEKVRGLCHKAVRPYERDERDLGERLPSCAAVCVYPALIPACVEALGRSLDAQVAGATHTPPSHHVKIASVATGFPSGQFPLEVRLEDVRRAVAAGADEIDMVISRGLFLAGKLDAVADEIRQTKRACQREDGSFAHLKVILETGELETLDNVRIASDLAIRAMDDVVGSSPLRGEHNQMHAPEGRATANIDFIKTSTGKVQPAATMPVTLVMLEAIRDWYLRTGKLVGMKPAGGIRTAKQAVHYLVMVHETMGPLRAGGDDPAFAHLGANPWLTPDYFRFGASTLCNDILRQIVKLKRGPYVAGYDFAEA
jgi:deoxyribose-phosphate aldolase